MDKDTEHSSETQETRVSSTAPNASRRRFARNAVVGSAVVFTLGNRAAWGGNGNNGGGNNAVCLSETTMASMMNYANGTGASMSTSTAEAVKTYQDELKKGNRVAVEGEEPGSSCVVMKNET